MNRMVCQDVSFLVVSSGDTVSNSDLILCRADWAKSIHNSQPGNVHINMHGTAANMPQVMRVGSPVLRQAIPTLQKSSVAPRSTGRSSVR